MPQPFSSNTCAKSAILALAFSLSACQGNIGSGTGLNIPQAPQYNQQGGPGGQQSRERAVEGAVYYSSPMPDLPLPNAVGFAIDINLGTPGPEATPTPVPTAAPSGKAFPRGHATSHPKAGATHASTFVAKPSVAPSADPPASAAPSSAPSAGPSPSPQATTQPGHHPVAPSASPSGPKIVTKTVAYPDDAPVLPTAAPTGNVQTFPLRKAIVRGYLMPGVDLQIYGLGAIRFTVPVSELTPGRGFTVAVFESQKHRKNKLLDSDGSPTLIGDHISSEFLDKPIAFRKNTGYEIVLYADELAAAPATVAPGYPPPGCNPVPAVPGTPVPPGTAPTPPATPCNSATAMPGGIATPVPPGYSPTPAQTFFR